jgi:hypothetical protein
MVWFLLVWLGVAVLFACLGIYVAEQCGRKSSEGFLLGLMFGPLGVVIVGLLPKPPQSTRTVFIERAATQRQALDESLVDEYLK